MVMIYGFVPWYGHKAIELIKKNNFLNSTHLRK